MGLMERARKVTNRSRQPPYQSAGQNYAENDINAESPRLAALAAIRARLDECLQWLPESERPLAMHLWRQAIRYAQLDSPTLYTMLSNYIDAYQVPAWKERFNYP